jgi:hypothetical protein
MKKTSIFFGFLAVFLTVNMLAFGASPFPPWLAKLYGDATISTNGNLQIASDGVGTSEIAAAAVTESKLSQLSGSTEGLYAQRVAMFIYDTATDGGSVGAHTLGVTLPAKAVITRSYFKIITQFVDSGSGTVALSCEDANNIKTATDITGSSANAFVEGQSTGAASAFVRGIAAACEITATVATAAQDAGKLIGWVEYVVED